MKNTQLMIQWYIWVHEVFKGFVGCQNEQVETGLTVTE